MKTVNLSCFVLEVINLPNSTNVIFFGESLRFLSGLPINILSNPGCSIGLSNIMPPDYNFHNFAHSANYQH